MDKEEESNQFDFHEFIKKTTAIEVGQSLEDFPNPQPSDVTIIHPMSAQPKVTKKTSNISKTDQNES